MAKLVDVFRVKTPQDLSRRQLPLIVDEALAMIMDLNGMGLVLESPVIRGKELDEFLKKYNVLTPPEVKKALEVNGRSLLDILRQTVPCVGCRRSVERLFHQLVESGHNALDPIIVTEEGILTIREEHFASPQTLCTMFHGHRARLISIVESQTRSKKSHRCVLHSLDSHRSPRPMTSAWRDVWECMLPQCKDEVVLIESSTLLVTLETYLRKHRFCTECRTKVLKAYTLLIEEPDPCREKGYVPALYAGIKRCLPEKHIHLQTRIDYIGNLITRADLELMGRRERHAKTLEIAQEEVLTCLGLCIYEKLYRVHLRMKEEECTCQVMAAVAIEALSRNFEMAVEGKQGVTQLELLYQQITKEELAKAQRKEHKKQKRKKKKEKRAEQEEKENTCECESEENGDHAIEETFSSCTCSDIKPATQSTDRRKLQVLDRKSKGSPACYCKDCQRKKKEKGSSESSNSCNFTQPPKIPASEKNSSHNRKVPNIQCSSQELSSPVRKTLHAAVTVTRNLSHESNSVQQNGPLSPCQSCKSAQDLDDRRVQVTDGGTSEIPNTWSSSDHSQDCGYSSENNTGCCDTASGSSSLPSSPDGSDIACSDGFCNHEGECHVERSDVQECNETEHNTVLENENSPLNSNPILTLEQMLEGGYSSDEDGEESYIPAEEVQEFKARMCNVTEQRQELRQMLRKKFDQLCVKAPQIFSSRHSHCASN